MVIKALKNIATNILIISLLVIGCNTDVSQKLEPKGSALGKMNEIVVIADDNIWEGPAGDTFRYYFESAYPIMPQPEPLFDLRHFTPNDLAAQPLRKELRTYAILANLEDTDSPTSQLLKGDIGNEKYNASLSANKSFSSVGKDKWARGQLLIYLYGSNEEQLYEAIKNNFAAATNRVHKHDEKQLRSSIYVDRVNAGLTDKVKSRFLIDFDIPGDYIIAKDDPQGNMLWLRKVGKKADQNIVLQRIKYTNKNQLSKEGIIEIRDKFGSTYVTSDYENDVMVVDNKNLPVYEYSFDLNEKYSKELRGIWKMTNSFSGGPFNTYVILDEAKSELLYIDVFVLGPGSTKRDLMMQLDHMVKTAKLIS